MAAGSTAAWRYPQAAALARLLACLLTAAVPASGRGTCDYGSVPGVWEGETYRAIDDGCSMVRYVEHIKGNPRQKEVTGEILFVGDSLNRNLILDAADSLGTTASDYTPIPYDDRGRPEKIGRNARMQMGRFVAANLFLFGAHETENHWLGVARAGIKGMHNSTYGRVCLDGPKYLRASGLSSDPYMIVINSNYWDAMHWAHSTIGPPPKIKKGQPSSALGEEMPGPDRPQAEWEGQVVGNGKLDNLTVPALMERQVDAVRDLVDIVRRCYPQTKLFCWHTAPLVSTDSRNPHWFDKRPHVVAALNAVGRFVAKEKGLCLIDWATMFQGRNNELEWVPDGLHPASHVSREFMNVVINVMMEHQGKHHGLLGNEDVLIRAMAMDTK